MNRLEVEIFNLLLRTPALPLTEEGAAVMQAEADGVFEQGVRNGGVTPGEVSPALALDIRNSTQDASFDGYLSSGFLSYVQPVAQLTQTQHDNRIPVNVKAWFKGAGAFHGASFQLIYEN